MNQVTEQEIVEIVKAHLSKMGWEYASHPELKPMFDLYTRIKQHSIAPSAGQPQCLMSTTQSKHHE